MFKLDQLSEKEKKQIFFFSLMLFILRFLEKIISRLSVNILSIYFKFS